MIFLGTDIKKSNVEPLKCSSFQEVVGLIRSEFLRDKLKRLNKVKQIDKKAFSVLKSSLPYFISSTFKDNLRSSSAFVSVNHLVLDIDNYQLNLDDLKAKLSQDLRVKMAFISPSGNGLKVVCSLNEPITSLKAYSDFYKIFSRSFAMQYQLEDCIDFSTCDATRICFLSYDPKVYYNPNSNGVEQLFYIDSFSQLDFPLAEDTSGKPIDEQAHTVSKQTYKNILNTLNPKSVKMKKHYIIPEPLAALKNEIAGRFIKFKLNVIAIQEINYGLKVSVIDRGVEVLVNVYYGKRGFTIVKSQKNAHAKALYEACIVILEDLIYNTDEQSEQRYSQIISANRETKETSRIIKLKPAL